MSKRTQMTPAMLERVAEQFRALSEPSRLALMSELFACERNVSELVDATGLSLANVSKHLGILHQAGWVSRRRDGLHVVYALADDRTQQQCDMMCARVRERAEAEAALTAAPTRRR